VYARRTPLPGAADDVVEEAAAQEPASRGVRDVAVRNDAPNASDGRRLTALAQAVVFWDVDTQVDFMHADGKLYVPDAEAISTSTGSTS